MAWWSIIGKSFFNVTLSWRYSSGLQSADLNPIRHRWDVVGQEICTIKVPIGRNSVTALPQFSPTSRRKISSTCWKYTTEVLKAEGGLTFDLWVYLMWWLPSVCMCVYFQSGFKVITEEQTFSFCTGHWNQNQLKTLRLFVSISSGTSSLGQFGDDPD